MGFSGRTCALAPGGREGGRKEEDTGEEVGSLETAGFVPKCQETGTVQGFPPKGKTGFPEDHTTSSVEWGHGTSSPGYLLCYLPTSWMSLGPTIVHLLSVDTSLAFPAMWLISCGGSFLQQSRLS